MVMMQKAVLVAAFTGVSVLQGCGDGDKDCTWDGDDDQCPDGELCLNSTKTGDCEEGDTGCICGTPPPQPCTFDGGLGQCPTGEECLNKDQDAECEAADTDCVCGTLPPPPSGEQCFGLCGSYDTAFCSQTPTKGDSCTAEPGACGAGEDPPSNSECFSESKNTACSDGDTDCFCFDTTTVECEGAPCKEGNDGNCGAGEKASKNKLVCVYAEDSGDNKKGQIVKSGSGDEGACAAGPTKYDGDEAKECTATWGRGGCYDTTDDSGVRSGSNLKLWRCSMGQTGEPSATNYKSSDESSFGFCIQRKKFN